MRPSKPADDDDASVRNLGGSRWVEHIEDLRSRVDAAAANGDRPSVFLATIGTPAMFTARAMFAKNRFEIAGIECRFGPVTSDPTEVAGAFAAGGALVACLCSVDAAYEEFGVPVAEALTAAGARRIYIAGTSQDIPPGLTQAGILPIGAGDDVHAMLADLVEFLGVA